MKRLTKFLCFLFLIVAFAACDSDADGDSNKIPLGSYEEVARRVLNDGEVVDEGANLSFQRTFKFRENQNLVIEVESDSISETGTAMGRYEVADRGLLITIESSTSSYYESDQELEYVKAQVVDESFEARFEAGGDDESYVFRGLGLILTDAGVVENGEIKTQLDLYLTRRSD